MRQSRYSGPTTISGGTLQLGNGGASGDVGASAVALSGGTYLSFNRTDAPVFTNALSLAGGGNGYLSVTTNQTVTWSGPVNCTATEFWKTGPGTLIMSNAGNVFNVSVVLQAGVLQTESLSVGGGSSSLGKGGLYLAQGGTGTLRYTGPSANTDRMAGACFQGAGANATLDIANAGTILTDTAPAGNNGTGKGFTKAGAGTLVFAATNTYDGPTVVNAGKLFVNATPTPAAPGAFTVNNSGTLGGTAALGTNVTVNTGGAIEAGFNGQGTLTLQSLTLGTVSGDTSSLTLTRNATPALLNVTNNNGLVINSGANSVTINVGGAAPALGQYPLITYAGTLGGTGFSAFKLGALPPRVMATLVDNSANHSIDLNVTGVDFPEWSGALGSEWSTNTLAAPKNWLLFSDGITGTDFIAMDPVLFNDTASGTTADISVADVVPAAVTFSNLLKDFTLTGSKAITGSASLTKYGSGTVTLANSNTYTGPTYINAGTLAFTTGGSANSSTLTLGDASGSATATLALAPLTGGLTLGSPLLARAGGNGTAAISALNTSGTDIFTGRLTLNRDLTVAGAPGGVLVFAGFSNFATNQLTVTSDGEVRFTGQTTSSNTTAPRLVMNGSGKLLIASTNDNYSLTLVANAGTTELAGTAANQTAGVTVNNNALVRLNGPNANQQIWDGGWLTLNGGGFDLNGKLESVDQLTGTGGTVSNSALGTTAILTVGANAGSGVYGGSIADGIGLVALSKIGAGTATLAGHNTYSGTTTISGGALQLGNGGATGDLGASALTVNNGTMLTINRSDVPLFNNSVTLLSGGNGYFSVLGASQVAILSGAITSGGTEFWKVGPGTLILSNANNSLAVSMVIQSGVLQTESLSLGGSSSSLGKGGIYIAQGSAGTLRYTGPSATTDRLSTSCFQGTNANATVDIADPATTLTVSSGMTSSGGNGGNNGFTKTGPGTLVAAAANGYTGPTLVNAGKLIVNGSLSAASAVSVATNAWLGGAGTVNGPITVQAGGTLQAGAGGANIATLTINNSLSLAGTTTFVLNRTNAQNSSRLAGLTTVTYGGALTLTNAGPALHGGDSFVLFGASTRNGAFSVTNLPALDPGLQWGTDDNFATIRVKQPPVIGQEPLDQSVVRWQPAAFSVTVSGGSAPFFYQWYFSNAVDGASFVLLPGATSATLPIPFATSTNEGAYYVVVTNADGFAISTTATLTTLGDSAAPLMVSVGSLNGWELGIIFDKPVDPASFDYSNFRVNDGGVTVNSATLRPDLRSVVLALDAVISGAFTVEASYIQDMNGNASGDVNSAQGQVLNPAALSQNMGAGTADPLYRGTAFNGTNDNFIEVLAGGSDIWNTNDGMHFVYQTFTNDFIATVRVTSLSFVEPWTKAGLMARETINANSREFALLATPDAASGGTNLVLAVSRDASNTLTTALGSAPLPAYPNVWLRVRRTGNSFFSLVSSNGHDWTSVGSSTPSPAYPATVLIGLATSAHSNAVDVFTKADYAGFQVAVPPALVPPSLVATQAVARTFSATNDLLAGALGFDGTPLSVLAVYGHAATFTADFNSGLPTGTSTNGTAFIDTTNGVDGSGVLKLTVAQGTQVGWFTVNNLMPGQAVAAFTASFRLRIADGSANPADGFSFNLTTNPPVGAWPALTTAKSAAAMTGPEEGLPSGPSICIDNYANSGPDVAPAIDVWWNGGDVPLGRVLIPKITNANYVPMQITLHADGKLDVALDGTNVFLGLPTPYVPLSGSFVLGARTGGQYETHWVDNLSITAWSAQTALGGTVTLTNDTVSYTPPADACGADTFYYVASDGQAGGEAAATASVTIPCAQVSGQLELEGFVGLDRVVAFTITGPTFTNHATPTLRFAGGIADYTLAVPDGTTKVSAKTAWNLRRGRPVTLVGSAAEVSFTGLQALRAGDLDGSNSVDLADYLILAAAWSQPDPVADVDGSGLVDLDDYFLLSNRWNESGDLE